MRKPAMGLLVVATALLAILLVGCTGEPTSQHVRTATPTPVPASTPTAVLTQARAPMPESTTAPTAISRPAPTPTPESTQVPTAILTSAPTTSPESTAMPATTRRPTDTPTPTAAPTLDPPGDRRCTAEVVMREGDYCTVSIPRVNVGTDRFEIRNGRGCYGNLCGGTGLTLNDFIAHKNSDESWTIDRVPEITPSDTFSATATATPTTPEPVGVLTFKDDRFGIHIKLEVLELVRGYAGDERSAFWLDSGNEWVKIVIEVKNFGEKPYSFGLPRSFVLVDANYSEVGDVFGAPDTGNLIEGEAIAPGATVRGDIVLQAPIGETILALRVEPIYFDAKYLLLTAGSGATVLPAPTPTPTATQESSTAPTASPRPRSLPTATLTQTRENGECSSGLVVRPGESCTYPGSSQVLSVDVDGKGRWSALPFLSFDGEINLSVTVNGREEKFVARPQGDGSWIIEETGDLKAQTSGAINTPTPTPVSQSPVTWDDLFTAELTQCSGEKYTRDSANVTVGGTVTAKRAIDAQSVMIELEASANGEAVGPYAFIYKSTWSAGESEEFEIFGVIRTSLNTLSCEVRWNWEIRGLR